jgi:hypothetical protein
MMMKAGKRGARAVTVATLHYARAEAPFRAPLFFPCSATIKERGSWSMATLVKNKLKAARDALGKKDWAAAQTAAQQALDFEADNYNACVALLVPMRSPDSCEHRNVFLGLASLELGSYEQSEQVIFSSTPLVHDVNLMSAGVSKGD